VAKRCVEGLVAVDVREWHRRGLMEPGRMVSRHWQRDGEEILCSMIEMDSNRVVLRQEYPEPQDWTERIEQPIGLTSSPCNYGGMRPWFRCPGVSCGRRVAILYRAERYFVCRKCLGLCYSSQGTNLTNRRLKAWKRVPKKRRIFKKYVDGRYEYFEVLPKVDELSKSRTKLNLVPGGEIEVWTQSWVDSISSERFARYEPTPDAPAIRTELKAEASDSLADKFRSEQPELWLNYMLERMRAKRREQERSEAVT
jgi:hypothetical protein